METATEKSKIHHGSNIRLARTWKKVTQTDLADKLNIHQTEVSALENKENIDDNILEQIAIAMEIPLDFLKSFDPEEMMKSFSVINNDTINMTNAENSSLGENIIQKSVATENNTYHPLEKVSELYERLIVEIKEKEVLTYRLEILEKKNDELENNKK